MAYSQADLDRLNKAVASGIMSVEVDGRRITYTKYEQLVAARAEVSAALKSAAGTTPVRRVKVYATKDL